MTTEQRIGLHFDCLLKQRVAPVLEMAKKHLGFLRINSLLEPEYQDSLFWYKDEKRYKALILYIPGGPTFKVNAAPGEGNGSSIKIEIAHTVSPDGPFYLHIPNEFEYGILHLLERCLIQKEIYFDPRPFPLEVKDERAYSEIGPYVDIMQGCILPQFDKLSQNTPSQNILMRIYSNPRFYSLIGGGAINVQDQCVCRFDDARNFYLIEYTPNLQTRAFERKLFVNGALRECDLLPLVNANAWANQIPEFLRRFKTFI